MSEPRRGSSPEEVLARLSAEHASIRRRSEEARFVRRLARWSWRLARFPQAQCLRIGRGARSLFLLLFPGRGGKR